MEKCSNFPIFTHGIECKVCGKDLLKNSENGVLVLIQDKNTDKVVDVYTACKGEHDEIMRSKYNNNRYQEKWYELSDFTNPILWLDQVRTLIERLQVEHNFDKNVISQLQEILKETFAYVSRELTNDELERVKCMSQCGLL